MLEALAWGIVFLAIGGLLKLLGAGFDNWRRNRQIRRRAIAARKASQ